MVLPTRVERPEEGGGWELLEDVYSKRVDFNQTGFTLHQVEEPDAPDAKTFVGSQPPGSQGPPSVAVEPTHAVDVEYTNIRCLKRGATLRPRALLDLHALTKSPCAETTDTQVIWTIGLNQALSEEDDDDFGLSKDAIAARADALKAMTSTAAAITLKFPLVDAASLEACVMPLIFDHNPVRHCSMHASAALWLTRMRLRRMWTLSSPSWQRQRCRMPRWCKASPRWTASSHTAAAAVPAWCVIQHAPLRRLRADIGRCSTAGRRHCDWRAAGGCAERELRRASAGAPAAHRAANRRERAARRVRCVALYTLPSSRLRRP